MVALDPGRFEVIFILLSDPGCAPTWMEQAGHQVFRLPDNGTLRFFHPALLSRLAHLLKSNQVDVLHCHNHKASLYGALAGTLAGTPVVLAQVHGLRRARNVRRKLANMFVFRRATKVICVADAVRMDVMRTNWRVDPAKLLVLENSVNYERFAGVSTSRQQARANLGLCADDFVFGTVGRLAPTKGLSYLLEAFAIVKAHMPSAQLVLLGDGPSKADLEQQAMRMVCRQAIRFLGHRSGIAELYRGLDVFVLSSVAEGMPRALLEAMAAGLPCIATDVGGIPEVFRPGNGEFLVPSRDAAALAQEMIRMARLSDEERTTIGVMAQQRIRQCYSHDMVREKLRAVYENAMEQVRGRREGLA